MIPTKKDIAFVEYADEASSGAAKDALHNYKLDGEQKIKVRIITPFPLVSCSTVYLLLLRSHLLANNCASDSLLCCSVRCQLISVILNYYRKLS